TTTRPPSRCSAAASGWYGVLDSAGLAVRGVRAAPVAELRELDAVRGVAAVLLGDVVPLLALRARQGDLGADVGALGCHGKNLLSDTSGGTRLRRSALGGRCVWCCSPVGTTRRRTRIVHGAPPPEIGG